MDRRTYKRRERRRNKRQTSQNQSRWSRKKEGVSKHNVQAAHRRALEQEEWHPQVQRRC